MPATGGHDELSQELFSAAVRVRETWAKVHAEKLCDALEAACLVAEQDKSLRPLFRIEPEHATFQRIHLLAHRGGLGHQLGELRILRCLLCCVRLNESSRGLDCEYEGTWAAGGCGLSNARRAATAVKWTGPLWSPPVCIFFRICSLFFIHSGSNQ